MNLAAGEHNNYVAGMEAVVFKLKSNNRRLSIVLLDCFIGKLVCIGDVSLRIICNSLLVWQSRPPNWLLAHRTAGAFVPLFIKGRRRANTSPQSEDEIREPIHIKVVVHLENSPFDDYFSGP